MKKIKLDTSILKLKKDKIFSLSENQQGQIQGGMYTNPTLCDTCTLGCPASYDDQCLPQTVDGCPGTASFTCSNSLCMCTIGC